MYIFHPKTFELTTTDSNPHILSQNANLETHYAPYFPNKKLFFIPSTHSTITRLVLNTLAYLSCGLIHRLKSFEDSWYLYKKNLKILAVTNTTPSQTHSTEPNPLTQLLKTPLQDPPEKTPLQDPPEKTPLQDPPETPIPDLGSKESMTLHRFKLAVTNTTPSQTPSTEPTPLPFQLALQHPRIPIPNLRLKQSIALRQFEYASAAICVFLEDTTTSSQAQARSADLSTFIPEFIQEAGSYRTELEGTALANQIDAICSHYENQWPQSEDPRTNLKHIQQTFDEIIRFMEPTVGRVGGKPWDEINKFNFLFETI